MTTGIYRIQHIESGRVYIGSAVHIERRFKDHRTRLNNATHGNEYLLRAWAKYGPDAFEWSIVEECAAEDRWKREQHWIDFYKADQEEFGFNLIPTRLSQGFGKAWSKVQKKRWSPHDKQDRRRLCAHLMEPETRARAQALATEAKRTPEFAELRRAVASRTITTEATRKKNSERLKRLWQDPAFRAARLAGLDRGREKTNAARRESNSGDEIV